MKIVFCRSIYRLVNGGSIVAEAPVALETSQNQRRSSTQTSEATAGGRRASNTTGAGKTATFDISSPAQKPSALTALFGNEVIQLYSMIIINEINIYNYDCSIETNLTNYYVLY